LRAERLLRAALNADRAFRTVFDGRGTASLDGYSAQTALDRDRRRECRRLISSSKVYRARQSARFDAPSRRLLVSYLPC
jgi:hypothetical protein